MCWQTIWMNRDENEAHSECQEASNCITLLTMSSSLESIDIVNCCRKENLLLESPEVAAYIHD